MTQLLITFLIVLLVPLFTATWRMSLIGLMSQGLLLGWLVLRRDVAPSLSTWILLCDVVLVRAFLAPRYFYGVLKARNAPRRNDVIPANLVFWVIVGIIALLAFRFADAVCGADSGPSVHVHIAVATTGVLLGMLVLASQDSPFSQMVGLVRIENSIVLFELAGTHHFLPWVQAGIALVFLASVLVLGGFLRRLGGGPAPTPAPVEDATRPTL